MMETETDSRRLVSSMSATSTSCSGKFAFASIPRPNGIDSDLSLCGLDLVINHKKFVQVSEFDMPVQVIGQYLCCECVRP